MGKTRWRKKKAEDIWHIWIILDNLLQGVYGLCKGTHSMFTTFSIFVTTIKLVTFTHVTHQQPFIEWSKISNNTQ